MEVVELKIVSRTSDDGYHVQLMINGNDCGYLYLSSNEYNFVVKTLKLSEDNLLCSLRYDDE